MLPNMLQSLILKPSIYLFRLQEHLYHATGRSITGKKLTTIAAQQKWWTERKVHARNISINDPKMIGLMRRDLNEMQSGRMATAREEWTTI